MKVLLLIILLAIGVGIAIRMQRRPSTAGPDAYAGFLEWELKAIETTKQTPDTHPNAFQIHLYCGHIYNDHKFHREAIQEYKKAIVLDSNRPAAHASLASTYEMLADYAKAIESWEAAQRLGERTGSQGTNIASHIENLKARNKSSKQ